MDFEKKFLHPTKSNETILVKWSKGYREVEIWFHDELIQSLKGANTLIKGITFQNDKLGIVTVKLSENPYFLNVIVNKIHSKTNLLHPAKNMKGVGNWFILPIIFSLLGVFYAIRGLVQESYANYTGIKIMLFFYGVLLALFVITFILCRFRIYILYIVSYGFFILSALVLIYSIIISFSFGHLDIGTIVFSIIYFAYLTGMTFGLRRIIRFLKHKRIQENLDESVLDN